MHLHDYLFRKIQNKALATASNYLKIMFQVPLLIETRKKNCFDVTINVCALRFLQNKYQQYKCTDEITYGNKPVMLQEREKVNIEISRVIGQERKRHTLQMPQIAKDASKQLRRHNCFSWGSLLAISIEDPPREFESKPLTRRGWSQACRRRNSINKMLT